MECSTSGLPIHHQLPEFTQTHVHWVGDAIQQSHPLSSSSAPAFNLSQQQGLFQWVLSTSTNIQREYLRISTNLASWFFKTSYACSMLVIPKQRYYWLNVVSIIKYRRVIWIMTHSSEWILPSTRHHWYHKTRLILFYSQCWWIGDTVCPIAHEYATTQRACSYF